MSVAATSMMFGLLTSGTHIRRAFMRYSSNWPKPMRCSEPGESVAVAIRASRVPGRYIGSFGGIRALGLTGSVFAVVLSLRSLPANLDAHQEILLAKSLVRLDVIRAHRT